MRVTVSNAGYSPKAITSAQGAVITWTFTGTRQHSVTDNLKLGPAKSALFNSGPRLVRVLRDRSLSGRDVYLQLDGQG